MNLKEAEDWMERASKIDTSRPIYEIEKGKKKEYRLTRYEKSSGIGDATNFQFIVTATLTSLDGSTKILPLNEVVLHFEKK